MQIWSIAFISPLHQALLNDLDIFFAVLFAVEMLMKWSVYGVIGYFKNPWNWIDAIVVAIGFVGSS